MDDRVRSLIVSAIVLLIILGIIGGVIFYIANLIRSRQAGTATRTTAPRGTIVVSASPSSSGQPGSSSLPSTAPSDKKVYTGEGFQLTYPKNWGLLTCSNSKNFEFDPTNAQDELNAVCDVAKKPVTVLVGSNTCTGGQTADKGGVTFNKNTEQTSTGVNYKWCTKTTPTLEFTHRFSNDGSRATSKEDFSTQVEEVISTLRFGTSS